ncbi:MAG: thermonuclease family protein, partial [bacterium]|nr:thermonuclease family protein [bacterium]
MKIAILLLLSTIFIFSSEPTYALESATVIRVYDGDTITIRIGKKIERIRLLGIDSPEVASKGKRAQCFANEARNALQKLVFKKDIFLTRDADDRNRDIY